MNLQPKVLGICTLCFIICACTPGRDTTGETAKGVSESVAEYREAPVLAGMVGRGELPSVDRRLPENPMLIQPEERVGEYGGTWRLAMVKSDFNTITRNLQYEGLVRWNSDWTKVIPNAAQSFTASKDSREYIFHLRKGMKWSDGSPFTADDIMFWYRSVYLNRELKPTHYIFLNGMEDQFTVRKEDDYTVVFLFDKPFGLFLQQMATMSGAMMTLYPAHYLKRFHPDFNPRIAELMEKEGVGNWIELFNGHRDGSVTSIHPGTPSLFAWIFEADTKISGVPGDKFTAVRNPYYWKIDTAFNQLPYLDSVEFTVVDNADAATMMAIGGEVDMQDRNITVSALEQENMDKGDYGIYKLVNTASNYFAVFFNLTSDDPVKRRIFGNRDFRIGLSYAINRRAIIDASGLNVKPFQVAPIKGTPFYDERMASKYTEYSMEKANRYLDKAGYGTWNEEGLRLGPDGKPIRFTLVVPDPYQSISDISLYTSRIQQDWRAVGVDLRIEMKLRLAADALISNEKEDFNDYDAIAWSADGGYDVILNPTSYLPLPLNRFAPRWGTWFSDPEDPNAEVPPPAVQVQLDLYRQLLETADQDTQNELMSRILSSADEQFYAVGVHSMPVSYGVEHSGFHNVPDIMYGSWTYPNPAPANPCQFFLNSQR